MKFNVEKLKAIAVPMSPESRAALRYRAENAYWLRLSFDIAIKIREILRLKAISKEELANLLLLTIPQAGEYLSGKYNFDLKTIAKLQLVLGESIIEIQNQDKAPYQFEYPYERYESIVPNQSVNQMDVFDNENIKINEMKFNQEKLNALAVPRSPEALAAHNYRRKNSEWLKLSSAISLKVRKILRLKGISQKDLANLLSVSEEEINELLSGKVNFDLKTIARFQTVLKEPIIEVNLIDNHSSD